MPLGFLHTHPGWGTGRQWGGRGFREPQLDAHRLWVPGGFAPQASRPPLGTLPGATSPLDERASVVRAALVGWRLFPRAGSRAARPLGGPPESLPCLRPAVSLSWWFTTPSAVKEKGAQSRGLSPPPRGLPIAGGAPAWTLGLRICQSFYDQVTSSQARSATRRLEAQRLRREGPAPGTSSPRVTCDFDAL